MAQKPDREERRGEDEQGREREAYSPPALAERPKSFRFEDWASI